MSFSCKYVASKYGIKCVHFTLIHCFVSFTHIRSPCRLVERRTRYIKYKLFSFCFVTFRAAIGVSRTLNPFLSQVDVCVWASVLHCQCGNITRFYLPANTFTGANSVNWFRFTSSMTRTLGEGRPKFCPPLDRYIELAANICFVMFFL